MFGFKVVKEYERSLLFVFGKYKTVKNPGLRWTWPLISKIITVDTRTQTVDIPSQDTVTKDSVTIKVNAVLYYRVVDVKKAILEVADYKYAINQCALTTLRNVIGQNPLDLVLKDRTIINQQLREIVDVITDDWGLKVERIEMKDVVIPDAMQRAMAKEAEAVRERRARIIKAEGEAEASKKLSEAAEEITKNPSSLELRRMQMITEVGAEHNTTTIMLMPSDFVTLANKISQKIDSELK